MKVKIKLNMKFRINSKNFKAKNALNLELFPYRSILREFIKKSLIFLKSIAHEMH